MWDKSSGVLLWMTHPAWPSMIWQTYSWDFETHGSYFGAKKACEPVHVQMNLHDNKVLAVNASLQELNQASLSFKVFDLGGKEVFQTQKPVSLGANKKAEVFTPDFSSIKLPDVYLVRLELNDSNGNKLSENSYWKHNGSNAHFQSFNQLADAQLSSKMIAKGQGEMTVRVENKGDTPAIGVKLNLVDGNKKIVLPAYFSDGYFTLLPGERKDVTVSYPANKEKVGIQTEAYNSKQTVSLAATKVP
jgi:hypothetical protein